MSAESGIRGTARRLREFPDDAVRAAVRDVKSVADDRLRVDTGGDGRLSGVRNAGRLTVTTAVRGTVFVSGRVSAGPRRALAQWSWIEDGTNPRRQGRGSHPGTPAKGTWSQPVAAEMGRVRDEVQSKFSAIFR